MPCRCTYSPISLIPAGTWRKIDVVSTMFSLSSGNIILLYNQLRLPINPATSMPHGRPLPNRPQGYKGPILNNPYAICADAYVSRFFFKCRLSSVKSRRQLYFQLRNLGYCEADLPREASVSMCTRCALGISCSPIAGKRSVFSAFHAATIYCSCWGQFGDLLYGNLLCTCVV